MALNNIEETEVTLTSSVYENIIEQLVNEVVRLKKEKGEKISRIDILTETLKSLKKEFKNIKIKIKDARKDLKEEKHNLSMIIEELNQKNHSITDLNYRFIENEECRIDLEEYGLTNKKR